MKKPMRKLVLALYAVAALWWLGQGLFWLWYEGGQPPVTLNLESAGLQEVEKTGEGQYAVLGGDGQMILEGLNARGGRLWLDGSFANPPREVDLYYQKAGQAAFSVKQRVFGQPQEGGGFVYRLPPGNYTALRIDTGTEPGNTLFIKKLVLHPAQPFYAYFGLSLRGVAAFLLVPALASCSIYTIIEWIQYGKNRRTAGRKNDG